MPTRAVAMALLLLLMPATASAGPRDRDRDRMADRWERKHRVSAPRGDRDRDGLTNLREYRLRTNPRRADSDRDGLRDGAELRYGWHPRVRDGDRDGVLDGRENAGVITAVEDLTVFVRLATGGVLTGRLEDPAALTCAPAAALGGAAGGGGDVLDDDVDPTDLVPEPVDWDPDWGDPPADIDGDDALLARAAQAPDVDPEDGEDAEAGEDDAAEVAPPACRALLRAGSLVHEATLAPGGVQGPRLTRLQLVG